MRQQLEKRQGRLALAAIAFLGANLVHTADHLRQHLAGLNAEILGGGTLLTLAALAVAVMAVRRYPDTELCAAVLGFTAAILVLASHVAPHWSVISDSYVDDLSVDAWSWAAMLLEVGTAFVLGLLGALQLRARHHLTAGTRAAELAARG